MAAKKRNRKSPKTDMVQKAYENWLLDAVPGVAGTYLQFWESPDVAEFGATLTDANKRQWMSVSRRNLNKEYATEPYAAIVLPDEENLRGPYFHALVGPGQMAWTYRVRRLKDKRGRIQHDVDVERGLLAVCLDVKSEEYRFHANQVKWNVRMLEDVQEEIERQEPEAIKEVKNAISKKRITIAS